MHLDAYSDSYYGVIYHYGGFYGLKYYLLDIFLDCNVIWGSFLDFDTISGRFYGLQILFEADIMDWDTVWGRFMD